MASNYSFEALSTEMTSITLLQMSFVADHLYNLMPTNQEEEALPVIHICSTSAAHYCKDLCSPIKGSYLIRRGRLPWRVRSPEKGRVLRSCSSADL